MKYETRDALLKAILKVRPNIKVGQLENWHKEFTHDELVKIIELMND